MKEFLITAHTFLIDYWIIGGFGIFTAVLGALLAQRVYVDTGDTRRLWADSARSVLMGALLVSVQYIAPALNVLADSSPQDTHAAP